VPFTPHELAAEHARAMRIVNAVLAACDARAATAKAAREHGLKPGDAPWVLSIGKAAIGMAEGLADVCGKPDRHLIVTVDGPSPVSLTNILRSDHPLPTQRSLGAGLAVKRFIEEAKAASAPSITALISGGASSLICEPIPGIDLDDYRAVVQSMLSAGWDIQRMNTARRAIDALKGGGLALLAAPLPIDLLVISDVIGNMLHDIGSGPFVANPSTGEDAEKLLLDVSLNPKCEQIAHSVLQRTALPRGRPCRRAIVAASSETAVAAARTAVEAEGLSVAQVRAGLSHRAEKVAVDAKTAINTLNPGEALIWSGEWPVRTRVAGYGGRVQECIASIMDFYPPLGANADDDRVAIGIATDGVDGVAPPGGPSAAGAWCWSGMTWDAWVSNDLIEKSPALQLAMKEPDEGFRCFAIGEWCQANSYIRFAHRDAHRPPHEPPAHIFTGPTGTNVNDLLIAWRIR
jgi:glycerate 2-kinase